MPIGLASFLCSVAMNYRRLNLRGHTVIAFLSLHIIMSIVDANFVCLCVMYCRITLRTVAVTCINDRWMCSMTFLHLASYRGVALLCTHAKAVPECLRGKHILSHACPASAWDISIVFQSLLKGHRLCHRFCRQ